MIKEIFVRPVYAAVEEVTALTGVTTLADLVTFIVNAIVIVGMAVVIIMLALGFIKYVSSQGEKTAVDSAQKTLTYAVLGGVGLALIYVLKGILFNILNLNANILEETATGGGSN